MPESGQTVEIAHELTQQQHVGAENLRWRWLGLAEAVVLAVVAIATAWSGYQASRWEGLSTKDYALYERYAVLSQEKNTLAGQDRLYDIVTFNGWIAAQAAGNAQLATLYERRFRPEYIVAFDAWKGLNPLQNPSAPAGPIFMAQYQNAHAREAGEASQRAERYFDSGVRLRDRGDDYVRVTVLLATVLFLTALSQRFDIAAARAAIVGTATLFLGIGLYLLITLPRW